MCLLMLHEKIDVLALEQGGNEMRLRLHFAFYGLAALHRNRPDTVGFLRSRLIAVAGILFLDLMMQVRLLCLPHALEFLQAVHRLCEGIWKGGEKNVAGANLRAERREPPILEKGVVGILHRLREFRAADVPLFSCLMQHMAPRLFDCFTVYGDGLAHRFAECCSRFFNIDLQLPLLFRHFSKLLLLGSGAMPLFHLPFGFCKKRSEVLFGIFHRCVIRMQPREPFLYCTHHFAHSPDRLSIVTRHRYVWKLGALQYLQVPLLPLEAPPNIQNLLIEHTTLLFPLALHLFLGGFFLRNHRPVALLSPEIFTGRLDLPENTVQLASVAADGITYKLEIVLKPGELLHKILGLLRRPARLGNSRWIGNHACKAAYVRFHFCKHSKHPVSLRCMPVAICCCTAVQKLKRGVYDLFPKPPDATDACMQARICFGENFAPERSLKNSRRFSLLPVFAPEWIPELNHKENILRVLSICQNSLVLSHKPVCMRQKSTLFAKNAQDAIGSLLKDKAPRRPAHFNLGLIDSLKGIEFETPVECRFQPLELLTFMGGNKGTDGIHLRIGIVFEHSVVGLLGHRVQYDIPHFMRHCIPPPHTPSGGTMPP